MDFSIAAFEDITHKHQGSAHHLPRYSGTKITPVHKALETLPNLDGRYRGVQREIKPEEQQ